jgi:hypothetical protein
MSDAVRWAWRPQEGPQKALVDCPVKETMSAEEWKKQYVTDR